MIDVTADDVRERQKKNALRAKKAKMQNKDKILAVANGMLNDKTFMDYCDKDFQGKLKHALSVATMSDKTKQASFMFGIEYVEGTGYDTVDEYKSGRFFSVVKDKSMGKMLFSRLPVVLDSLNISKADQKKLWYKRKYAFFKDDKPVNKQYLVRHALLQQLSVQLRKHYQEQLFNNGFKCKITPALMKGAGDFSLMHMNISWE